ncbi:SIR2 family protein [Pedobacter sp. HDW13]|uniref:SIR2 family protein n=1 Tax=Pedobacter sp. HDW13 TaxID=2714940 RepID=UPI001408DE66|nr:SIR2 family protein [Pedobacter sp. HDW13]QIL42378.1 SIR2 family protein [Pedobacter sp. HDW13]
MDYQKKIKEQLSNGLIIPVVGAGVSYATSGIPGWKGLIENGLAYAANSLGVSPDKILEANDLLKENKLTAAADIVKNLLNAPGHPFTNWLNYNFERPEIKSTDLIQSIQNLCQPIIATTNYDDLLRTVGSAQTDMALDWSQHEEIQSCLSQHRRFILHLHGLYTRPTTPIFGAGDYENLRNQLGYKTILNQLWMHRHFLFIGCSRDGVMDEDFMSVLKLMQEWFPGQQKEHYILMSDKEIGSQQHLELLQKCNVHLVPFGKDYNELPHFINHINPNAKEIVQRYNQQKERAFEGIRSILEAQQNIDVDQTVKEFIKENLGLPYYWLSNDKIKIFMDALENYNSGIQKKREKFVNLQVMMRAIINISDLKSKIALWAKNSHETNHLNNIDFINMGILAWELLISIPEEILEEIKIRDLRVVHHAYFAGTLSSFYHEAKSWKDSGKPEDLDGDRYFFENLVRIMNSLLGILELNVNDLYNEKPVAKIAVELPKEFVLAVCPKSISITKSEDISEVVAELPWDESLEFSFATVITVGHTKIVIGFNSQYCFKWNPTEELTATNFFEINKDEVIVELEVLNQGQHIVLEIYTSKRKILMVNFSDTNETKLEKGFVNYVKLLLNGKTYCKGRIEKSFRGASVFELSSLGEYHPKITSVSLWEQLLEIPEINAEYHDYLKQENFDSRRNDILYPYVADISLSKVGWIDKELLALKIRFGFTGPDSTAIFIIDPSIGYEKPIFKIYFPHKICFCFDTFSYGENVDLIVGYLDFNDVGNLVQHFEKIQQAAQMTAYNQPGLFPQEILSRTQIRDMFYTTLVSPNRALLIEEGKILHDVNLRTQQNVTIEFEDRIRSVRYFQ